MSKEELERLNGMLPRKAALNMLDLPLFGAIITQFNSSLKSVLPVLTVQHLSLTKGCLYFLF